MSNDQANPCSNQYVFNYKWEVVVKGFWLKYPCPQIDFVKWNKVIDLIVNPDNTLTVKRIVFAKQIKFMWCLTLEEIKLDFQNRILEMKTEILEKSKLFPSVGGQETSIYKTYSNDNTIYLKQLSGQGFIFQYANQFSTFYKKGIQVIEERCKEVVMAQNQF